MSQSAKKEEQPLNKIITRMGSIFRSRSKRASQSNIPTLATGKSSQAQAATATTPAATTQTTRTTAQNTQQATASATETTQDPSSGPIHWSTVQQERARALFVKYGLTLEPHEWMSPRDLNVERVEKPIRMRVRRTCHRCQTTYGPDKVCVNCQHVRCKKCARYPPARTPEEKEARAKAKAKAKAVEGVEATAAGTTPDAAKKRKLPPLTMPSRTGGQDLIYKTIRQRIRRTCHRCQTLFQGDSKECSQCSHVRCKKCPRDPPKLHKYPDGYPGDVDPPPERPPRTWKKPRMRVRYTCHVCQTLYMPHERTCGQCGQEKGPDTIRVPPKKIKPDPDPEIVRRVQDRLAALTVSHAHNEP